MSSTVDIVMCRSWNVLDPGAADTAIKEQTRVHFMLKTTV